MKKWMSAILHKHKDNSTVALEVIKRFFVKEKNLLKLKIIWWNIGECHPPYSLGIKQNIKINRDVWRSDWALYSVDKVNKFGSE